MVGFSEPDYFLGSNVFQEQMILPKKTFRTFLIIIVSIFLSFLLFGDEKLKTAVFSGKVKDSLERLDKQGVRVLKKLLGQRDFFTPLIKEVNQSNLVQETKQRVETTISQATNHLKNLPAKQLEKLKKEIKCQICRQWLKEEE